MKKTAKRALLICVFILACSLVISRINGSKIYTEDDIYIVSFECGYIYEYNNIRYNTVIIETEEQLVFAEENYGLAVLNIEDKKKNTCFESPFAVAFHEMKEQYPIQKYNYVFSYDEVSTGGYYYHADRLKITKDNICFLMDDASFSPKGEELVTDVMGGFGHMAAVPKEYMEGREFPYAIYPNENDLSQDCNYKLDVKYDLAGKELYQVYGNEKYIIQNVDEYEAFLSMYQKHTGDEYIALPRANFDEVGILVCFFTRDEPYVICRINPIEICENDIILDYELVRENSGEKGAVQTCMIYAHIPKRFLTEESYEGWTTP